LPIHWNNILPCEHNSIKNDYSSQLEEYNPAFGDSPWFYNETKKTHYRNGNYCLEFMFEEDFPIDIVKKI
jgi:hypothetical protein